MVNGNAVGCKVFCHVEYQNYSPKFSKVGFAIRTKSFLWIILKIVNFNVLKLVWVYQTNNAGRYPVVLAKFEIIFQFQTIFSTQLWCEAPIVQFFQKKLNIGIKVPIPRFLIRGRSQFFLACYTSFRNSWYFKTFK